MFPQLDFDAWLHQNTKGKPKTVPEAQCCRWYECLVDGCDFKRCHRAQEALRHVAANHQEYIGKHVVAYKIAVTADGSPDYFPDWKLRPSGQVVPMKQKLTLESDIGHPPSGQLDKRFRKPAAVYMPGDDLQQPKTPKSRKTVQTADASMLQVFQAQLLDFMSAQKEADRKAAAIKEEADRKSMAHREKEDKRERQIERNKKEAQEEADRQERAAERKSREVRETLDRQERAAERAQMRQACEAVLSVANAVSQSRNEDYARL